MVLGRRRADAPAVVVLAEDTTASDFSGPNTLVLGPIGNGAGQGDACHHPRAVAPRTRAISGLVDQLVHRRRQLPQGEGPAAKRRHPDRERRSGVQAADHVGSAAEGKLGVPVRDRAADPFAYLDDLVGNRRSFVFRSCPKRALESEADDAAPRLRHDRRGSTPSVRRREWESSSCHGGAAREWGRS